MLGQVLPALADATIKLTTVLPEKLSYPRPTVETSMIRGAGTHIQATAYHEAGHALAAMREGRPLVFVQIFPNSPGAGLTRHLIRRRRNPFNPALGPGDAQAAWQDTLSRYLTDIRILLAGPLAEARAFNKPLRTLGAESDLHRCQSIAKRLELLREHLIECGIDCGSHIHEQLNHQRDWVRRWVARPVNWEAITRIADLLVNYRQISAREVLESYLAARDGRQLSLSLSWDC